MAPKVTLHYFKYRCRAEMPRLIMEAGGIAYDEVRLEEDTWDANKPNYPFGVTPVLHWDGEEISQSMTICRFLGKMAGLSGANDLESVRADLMAENVNELLIKYWDFYFSEDETQKKKLMAEFVEKQVPTFFKYNEAFLKKHGGKFSNGASLSYGDIAIFFLIDSFYNNTEMTSSGLNPDQCSQLIKVVEAHPLMAGVYNMVKTNEKVATYMQNRVSAAYPC